MNQRQAGRMEKACSSSGRGTISRPRNYKKTNQKKISLAFLHCLQNILTQTHPQHKRHTRALQMSLKNRSPPFDPSTVGRALDVFEEPLVSVQSVPNTLRFLCLCADHHSRPAADLQKASLPVTHAPLSHNVAWRCAKRTVHMTVHPLSLDSYRRGDRGRCHCDSIRHCPPPPPPPPPPSPLTRFLCTVFIRF